MPICFLCAAAELSSVKGAIFLVNQTAQALLTSNSTAEEPMLRLNLQDVSLRAKHACDTALDKSIVNLY